MNMINVWYEVKRYLRIPNNLSSFSPIWGNTTFKPGSFDAGFKVWASKGMKTVADLYSSNQLMSFREIAHSFEIPGKHFFKYSQIKHFISTSQQNSLMKPPLTILEREMIKDCYNRGLISSLYDIIISGSQESSNRKLKLKS